MSYDLCLFRIPDGVDPASAYAELMEREEQELAASNEVRRVISPAGAAQLERAVRVLESWRPTLQRFVPAAPLTHIELNDDLLEVQYEVNHETVRMSVPYFRKNGRELIRCMAESLDVLQPEFGYTAFDPQLERAITSGDLDQMVAAYERVGAALPETVAEGAKRLGEKRKSWWKFW